MNSRLTTIAAVLVLALSLIGCAPADCVYSLYEPTDAASDDRLLGTWQPVATDSNSEKDWRWNFVHSKEDKFYDFTFCVRGEKGGLVAKARLVEIGNYLFVDFKGDLDRTLGSEKLDSLITYPVVPTHAIGRIWIEKDALRIHFLKDDWAKDQSRVGKLALAHLDLDGYPLITANTEDLRKFVQAHAEDTDALSENYELERVK
jgi:hypothetical protein